MPRIVQLCVAFLLPLYLEGCQQCRWCPVERELISGTRPVVEPHEVEFLPMLPDGDRSTAHESLAETALKLPCPFSIHTA